MFNQNSSSTSSSSQPPEFEFNSKSNGYPIILKSNAIRNQGMDLIMASMKLNHSSSTINALAYEELVKYKNCRLLDIQLECMKDFKNNLPLNVLSNVKLIKSSLNENTSIDKFFPSNKTVVDCKNLNKLNDLNIKELFANQQSENRIVLNQPAVPAAPPSTFVGRNNNKNEDEKRKIIIDNTPLIIKETQKNGSNNKYDQYLNNNHQRFGNNYNSSNYANTSPESTSSNTVINDFMSGSDALRQQIASNPNTSNYEYKRQLSTNDRKDGVKCKFIPPIKQPKLDDDFTFSGGNGGNEEYTSKSTIMDDKRLKNIEPKIIELIENEIIDSGSSVNWNDIAGLDNVKSIIQEMVIWPMLRPDIFTGLRRPPRGILLFGPPGTGKTLIGKCIASQSKSTFFSISASSLTSKWMGEGEKMVRALFAIASVHQPSVIFIDEIDSLLCQRTENDHESSRRIKTEFLVQLDGAATNENDRLLIIGATNRPQELDEAARRRLVKRLYIPLPKLAARIQIVVNLLASEKNALSMDELEEIGKLTDGFSGADMKTLCHEASMEVIRGIPMNQMETINPDDVRTINFNDFKIALSRVRASVSQNDLNQYIIWDKQYGSGLICSSAAAGPVVNS